MYDISSILKDSKMDSFSLRQDFEEQKKKMLVARRQLYLVNNQINDLNTRIMRAEKNEQKNFKPVLYMKMVALEGMSQYLHQYLHKMFDQLDFIKAKIIWTDYTCRYEKQHDNGQYISC